MNFIENTNMTCRNVLRYEQRKQYSDALCYAARQDHVETLKLLLERGADVQYANGFNAWTALHEAALCGSINACNLLLDRGADINAKDKYGSTPLYYAAGNGRKNACKLLLDRGADVNASDNRNWTPLHDALNSNTGAVDIDICCMLLDAGADINAVTSDGFTPLHLAAKGGNINACRLLVYRGADLTIEDSNGKRPLDDMSDISWLGEEYVKLLQRNDNVVYVVTKERHMFQWEDVGAGVYDWVRWDDEYDGMYIDCVLKHKPRIDELQMIALNDSREICEWMRDFFGGDGKIERQMIDTPLGTRSKGIMYATAEAVYDERAKVEVTVCVREHVLGD